MTTIRVREINRNFSEILHKLQCGEEVSILQGRNRVPVAKIVPYFSSKNDKTIKDILNETENFDLEFKEKDILYYASESVLAKDWLNKEEDEAWKNL